MKNLQWAELAAADLVGNVSPAANEREQERWAAACLLMMSS
jgi:hypothetical protein